MMRRNEKSSPAANPLLLLISGLCPVLIPTFTFQNGVILGFGIAIHAIILAAVIPILKNLVSESLRFLLSLTVSAIVSVIYGLVVRLLFPASVSGLSPFLALIALNCFSLSIIRGSLRQDALEKIPEYARSAGAFFVTVLVFAALRELIGSGVITIYRTETARIVWDLRSLVRIPIRIALLPSGAFLLLGYGIALYQSWRKHRRGVLS